MTFRLMCIFFFARSFAKTPDYLRRPPEELLPDDDRLPLDDDLEPELEDELLEGREYPELPDEDDDGREFPVEELPLLERFLVTSRDLLSLDDSEELLRTVAERDVRLLGVLFTVSEGACFVKDGFLETSSFDELDLTVLVRVASG
jgi:hypothetical protein